MKWEEVKDQFFQAAERLDQNVDYITRVGQAFEVLIKTLQERDPSGCVDQINADATAISSIFKVEDPENVPTDAVNASSQALAKAQQFLYTFLRVAALLQQVNPAASVADIKIPPGSLVH